MQAEQEVIANVPSVNLGRQVLRFGLHLLVVYAIVNFTTLWLSGFVHSTILPILQQHQPRTSGFQFAFEHLFLFSFYPALAVSFIYAHWFRHKVAYFVWIVPLLALAYKFIVFPSHSSVLSGSSNRLSEAFHHFIAGNFAIEEFHSWGQLFDMAGTNPDMWRGMDQLHWTAPLYAAIGYSFGTFLGINVQMPRLHSHLVSMKAKTPVDEQDRATESAQESES